MNIDNYLYYHQHNGKTGIFSILLLLRLAFSNPSAISFPRPAFFLNILA